MSLSLFLTNKYLRSKKDSRFISVISLITIIGIALGVTVVVIALTVLDGFEKVVSEKIVDMNSHIKITSFGNRNLPPPNEVIPFLNKKMGSEFQNIEPFVSKLAIIKSKKRTEGITVNGILNNSSDIELKNFIISGNLDLQFDSTSLPSILVGKILAEKLFIKVDDVITIFALKKDEMPTFDNPPAIQQFIVKGIYESGMSEYDDLNAFINISLSQEIFGMDKSVSGYNIKVNNLAIINSISEKLQDELSYPFYVRTIYQIHQNIFTWLELQKKPIPIILGLIIFVAVFNIIGTMLMIVLERTNSIGVIRSLGANRKVILKVFLYHSVYITFIGILLGNMLALILSYLQMQFDIISLPQNVYFLTKVPIVIMPDNYLLVTAITFIISILASLIPAIAATKVKPITAIRFN